MNIWPGVVLLLGILVAGSAFALYAIWGDRRRKQKGPKEQEHKAH